MRVRLLICLLALLNIGIPAQARDNLLPACSDAQLATLAEMQVAYESLIEVTPSMNKRDSFSPYIEAYFGWRAQLRSETPLCAEIFEIAVLMERNASNLVASPALSSVLLNAAMPPTANPYLDELSGEGSPPDELARQIELAEARLRDDARVSPEERQLRACADADYDVFYAEVSDKFIELAQTMAQGRTRRNLLLAVETVLAWREQVWASLPACAGMHEIVWMMAVVASDLVVNGAFELAGMQPEADLFEAAVSRNSAAIAEMTPAFLGKAVPDASPPDSTLPGCAHSQLKDYLAIVMEYAELANAAAEVASFDDVLALGQRQYDWREKRLLDAPRCAEALELSLLIDQSTSDVVLVMALLLAGVEEDDIPHRAALYASSARMSALVTPILEGERAGADTTLPARLRQCSAAQLTVISNEVEPDFRAIIDASSAVETLEDLLRLAEMQIAFRENVWRRLPACAEAYDIAWLMYRVTGDDMLTWALLAAGADEADIPQSTATRAGISRLNTMLAEIAEG